MHRGGWFPKLQDHVKILGVFLATLYRSEDELARQQSRKLLFEEVLNSPPRGDEAHSTQGINQVEILDKIPRLLNHLPRSFQCKEAEVCPVQDPIWLGCEFPKQQAEAGGMMCNGRNGY